MKTTKLLYTLSLVLISVFLVSLVWEFALEDLILPLVVDGFEPESSLDRWEYVITATAFAGLALVLPAVLLVRAARRLRALQAWLEARVEHGRRELKHELAERLSIEQALRKEISERQLAESLSARLGRIIENSPNEVYVLDAGTLRFIDVNRAGRKNLGYSSEQLRRRGCVEVIPGWTQATFEERVRPLREGGLKELVFETRQQREDGSQYDAECRLQYLPSEKPPVFVAILQDITPRKKMEAQILEARDRAEVASAAKSLFLANISHELRTPIGAVIGMSDVLAHTPLSPEQRHYVQTIHNSGTAFLDIIDGLLDLSKIESGKFTPREGEFELHAVVEDMLDMLAYRAAQRGLELLSLVDKDVPAWLRGDALALRQILLNLLGNAIKFTEHGEVDVRVSVAQRSPQQCRLRFAVRDTGAGIASERQGELFQPFTSRGASPKRYYEGAGLGLSICKSLIESMHGSIGVDSVPGEGSLFWCEVDFAIEAVGEEQTASTSLPAAQRALVVDDNRLACTYLASQLEALGVQAESVGGASEALEVLRQAVAGGDPFAIAVIDADMPGIDGLSLAYAIKSDASLVGTRVLMLTPVDAPIVAKTQELIGFEMQCPKPIRQSQLPDILEMLTGRQQPAEEGVLAASVVPDAEARPLRVLVVEDQPVNQELMQLTLRRLGCEVALAGSGEEALDLLVERTQDVVFMDCRITVHGRRVVIIAMTALAMQGERERCLAAGMDDYLSKPVSAATLRGTLQRWFPEADLGGEQGAGAATVDADARAALRQMQAARPELVPQLVDLFLNESVRSLEALRETQERGDGQALAKMAHALKGACLQLGETGMADSCERLEAAGQSGDRDAANAALADLSEAFEQASARLLVLKARAARAG